MVRTPDLLAARAAVTLAIFGASTLLLVVATAARAEYTPGADPVSATETQLGDQPSTNPAMSRDGRYVVFRTESLDLLGPSPDPNIPYTQGLVRKDLLTGALEPIGPPGTGGSPSISADGRYVLFESTTQLVPGDTNTRSDVYVRDMTRAVTDAGAYELVSSLDGPEQAPVYATGGSRAGQRGFGLSSDGRTAVFWTEGQSNLPAGGNATTPRAQVFVRYLDRDGTRLVTRDKADPTLPGTPVPPSGGDPASAAPNPALSGNGTAVAWLDTNPVRQVRYLNGEPTVGAAAGAAFLWRDLTGGLAASARRLTGISDPDDPACPADFAYVESETATGPCYGPFTTSDAQQLSSVAATNQPLSISDDGRRVAFISPAHRRPFNPAFDRGGAYVVDMTPGLSRKQGTREPVSLSKALYELRPIQAVDLSGDGRHLIISSKSNTFDGPRPIGVFQTGELTATNVFVVDLGAGSIERATRGFDGSDYLGTLVDPLAGGIHNDTLVANLSASDDASTIAFDAADGNLFVGDANGVQDVQVVREAPTFSPGIVPPAASPPAVLPDAKVTPLKPIHPIIGYVVIGRHGVATVRVRVPSAGRLSAEAKGRAGRRRVLVGKATRRVRKPATTVIRVFPSKSALAALRRHTRLKVTMRILYRPRRGASTRASRGYTLSRGEVR
jgi:WD40-like Beta Propeller Repeat